VDSPSTAWLPAQGLPDGVRAVEHTADTGIDVEASSLEECFGRAAAGMFACFTRGGEAGERILDVEVRADGLDELLVAWLDELLFQAEVGNLLLLGFEVIEVGLTRLRARVAARALRQDDAATGSAVKAVTRHDLAVRRVGDRWRARVIFDV